MRARSKAWAIGLFIAAGCATTARTTDQKTPLFDDLGSFHRPITTRSAEAQRYFDQGLTFYHGFSHDAARRSFGETARLDPSCAMAYWGMALAAGPHINNPAMDDEQSVAAYENLERAKVLAPGSAPVERDLIAALSKRYAWPAPKDRAPLDAAYAEAMREVWRKYPKDADVGALLAESLMDLRPWGQWSPEGQPAPETPEILATLEAVLAMSPKHPLANHLAIHAWEASPTPEKALPSANRLRELCPGVGHLVHMPSHIDIRLGHYADAEQANARAIAADRRYVARMGSAGFNALYRAHDFHFLVWAARFEGRSAVAMGAARDLVLALPTEQVLKLPDYLDGFVATPYHVEVRFGQWREILDEPAPPSALPMTTAVWRYARTLALSSLGRMDEARAERDRFERACAAVPETALVGNNKARVVLEIARPMVEGELEYRAGNVDRAFEILREAVKRDDALKYDEPWGWLQPARHALGALLLEQGRLEEAEAVYRADLIRHPENGWSLRGLAECLRRRGEDAEAQRTEESFARAWARADVQISSSCYCRLGRS